MAHPSIMFDNEMWEAIGHNADVSKAAFVRQACREKLNRDDPEWEARVSEAAADD